tara:strand:- start:161 stop:487 length:327 start_codon:yes stop_codon:yes gene_type:complete
MQVTPTLIQKKDNGKFLSVHFEDKSKFNISSELLRVESPSADIQGHGGPKIIVRNKGNVSIDQIEPVGNYAVRIIFSDSHSSGIYSWELLYDFGKNHDKYLQNYYSSL